MARSTDNAQSVDIDALLNAWIADAVAETGTSGRVKGNAEGKCLGVLQSFASSDVPVLKIDADMLSDWTFTRKGTDPDGFRTMREVYNMVTRTAATMPDAPIYVVTFTTDDDTVTVLNTGVAATEALEAHKIVVQRAIASLQRASNAQKSLGPNAPASHVRAAQDRRNKAEAKVANATADAKRLLVATIGADADNE